MKLLSLFVGPLARWNIINLFISFMEDVSSCFNWNAFKDTGVFILPSVFNQGYPIGTITTSYITIGSFAYEHLICYKYLFDANGLVLIIPIDVFKMTSYFLG